MIPILTMNGFDFLRSCVCCIIMKVDYLFTINYRLYFLLHGELSHDIVEFSCIFFTFLTKNQPLDLPSNQIREIIIH